jgi:hypothetical protein
MVRPFSFFSNSGVAEMITTPVVETVRWVPLSTGRRKLAASRATILKLIRAGRLSVLQIPGARPKLRLDEIDRLVEQSTRTAVPAKPPAH